MTAVESCSQQPKKQKKSKKGTSIMTLEISNSIKENKKTFWEWKEAGKS